MNELDPRSTPPGSEPVFRRFFSRRHWPKYLFATICLATLVVLFLVLERRRGPRAPAVAAGSVSVPAEAERAVAARLLPPLVPDEQNFAATPFFALLFDKATARTSNSRWPDDFTQADQWPRRFPTLPESAEGRKTGRLMTDLVAWRKAFEQSRSGINGEEIVASDAVDPAANAQAAAAVLAALKPYEPVMEELLAV